MSPASRKGSACLNALYALRNDPRYARHITAWRRLEAQPARYAPDLPPLHPRLLAGLRARQVERLYTHQADAVNAVLAGRHVVVVTPTASGKTLCYNLPVLHALLSDPEARALYLFPTKALAQDQLAELQEWEGVLKLGFRPATYDGDTTPAARKAIRQESRIVITNPDMLHVGILPHHTRWATFFAGLRYVVVDEMHAYRGVFGSHVANVLRRLKRVAAFYGARPQFICASATIANPEELARLLIEENVVVVANDGSPKGTRHFLFYNPPLVDRALGVRRSAILEAQALARPFLEHDVQTIIFTPSRLSVELLLRYLRREVAQPDDVRGYRGGYLPRERREIERGLREGTVRAVVATNALELGVDIGQLDACLMAGYPGTIASTWQQAGRAGRRPGDASARGTGRTPHPARGERADASDISVAILVAGGSPLEQYIVTHPDYFFGRSPENARINPDNLLIRLAHLRCAAFELPFAEGEEFGGTGVDPEAPDTREMLAFLQEEGVVHRSADRWFWLADAYPAQAVSLRTAGSERVVITAVTDGRPQVIGEVDRQSAPFLVHEGAIYLHQGQAYHVDALNWEAGVAIVRAVDVDHYTVASTSVDVRPVRVIEEKQEPGATVAHGEVEVTSKATSYRLVRMYTQETLGWGEINLPEQTMLTTGYWFILSDEVVGRLREAGFWRFDPLGDRGPNWVEQRDRARARDGYRCRQCGATERPGRQHDVHHIVPFRDFGYVPGQNDAYLQANALDNLITLCRNCHAKVEGTLRFQGALSGLGHVLGHVAPLYLMCDWRDIGVLAEAQAAWSGAPTVTVYERVPAGVGFAETLYRLHRQLLETARELIADCPCERGCPACTGPVNEGDLRPGAGAPTGADQDPKGYTLAILHELLGVSSDMAGPAV